MIDDETLRAKGLYLSALATLHEVDQVINYQDLSVDFLMVDLFEAICKALFWNVLHEDGRVDDAEVELYNYMFRKRHLDGIPESLRDMETTPFPANVAGLIEHIASIEERLVPLNSDTKRFHNLTAGLINTLETLGHILIAIDGHRDIREVQLLNQTLRDCREQMRVRGLAGLVPVDTSATDADSHNTVTAALFGDGVAAANFYSSYHHLTRIVQTSKSLLDSLRALDTALPNEFDHERLVPTILALKAGVYAVKSSSKLLLVKLSNLLEHHQRHTLLNSFCADKQASDHFNDEISSTLHEAGELAQKTNTLFSDALEFFSSQLPTLKSIAALTSQVDELMELSTSLSTCLEQFENTWGPVSTA